MSVGKVFEWLIIAVVAVIGGRWLLGIIDSGIGGGTTPQTLDPAPGQGIGWPYGTGVVYLQPGIVGAQWAGPNGAPGSPANPWVGPGSPGSTNLYPWRGGRRPMPV
jgi:hypothetical protein